MSNKIFSCLMAVNSVSSPIIGLREKSKETVNDFLLDIQNFEDLISQESVVLALRSGRESLLCFLCDNIKKLVTLAFSDSLASDTAYSVLQSERLPILAALLDNDLLNQFSQQIFADTSTRAFVRFVGITTICLTKCTRRAASRLGFFRKFAHFVDEPCVVDMIASLCSVRSELREAVQDFVTCSNIVAELLQVVGEKPEGVYRTLFYLTRMEQVKVILASPEVLSQLVFVSEADDHELSKCKWRFFGVMLSAATYPLLRTLTKPAEAIVLSCSAFTEREAFCFDFLMQCCRLDREFGEELVGIGFIENVFSLVWRMPGNVHLQLRIANLCGILAEIASVRDAVVYQAAQFSAHAIEQRESNLPMAAVAWNLVRNLGCIEVLPPAVKDVVEHLNNIYSEDYGGPWPRRADYDYSLTPDELITFFKILFPKRTANRP